MKTHFASLTSILFRFTLCCLAASAVQGQGPKAAAADDGPVVKEDIVYGRVHGAALVAAYDLP